MKEVCDKVIREDTTGSRVASYFTQFGGKSSGHLSGAEKQNPLGGTVAGCPQGLPAVLPEAESTWPVWRGWLGISLQTTGSLV